jgi:PPK2 family polyphosphate:nucleotide phosphotransferase
MDFDKFKVSGQKAVKLSDFETKFDAGLGNRDLKAMRSKLWSEIAELQQKLYAESKQSLLVVLQAMDAAGKDSTIAKLTSRLNAQGSHVHSFKKPSKLELSHDFLWRVHAAAPAAGEMTIFNRSHYEDVLVVKVHGWASEKRINARYQHINNFENLLADRGTSVIKFMLNISPEYQLERFKRRLDMPGKHWKFNPGDLDERKLWGDYMQAFEVAMTKCASERAPWYVVPAEDRLFRDVMIATLVRDQLIAMQPEFPAPEFDSAVYTSDSIG